MTRSAMARLWLTALLLVVFMPGPAAAFSRLTIEADTDRKQLRVGESLRLKLIIVQQATNRGTAVEATLPPELPPLPGFSVSASQSSQNINVVQNVMQVKSVQEYYLVAERPGRQFIPAIPYRYVDPQTHQPVQLQTRPLEVEVLPASGAAATYLWLLGIGLIGAGSLASLLVIRGRRPPPKTGTVGPAEPTEAPELRKIRFFLETRQVESYFAAISDAVRLALERRYGIPARVQTTAELLAALRSQQAEEPAIGTVRSCLERCDLAKFAGYTSTVEEMQETLLVLKELLEQSASNKT